MKQADSADVSILTTLLDLVLFGAALVVYLWDQQSAIHPGGSRSRTQRRARSIAWFPE